MTKITAVLLTGLLGLAGSAGAAGFRLSEQDAKANGMGNSFVAAADNAAAVWYNPAALTGLGKTSLSLGTVMVYPGIKHRYTGGSDEAKKTLHLPPHFYAARRLNEKCALGFGFNTPFGLSTDWGTASRTKYVATLSSIKAFNYNLNGAYKVNDSLSFALGADYVALDATLNTLTTGGELKLSGDGAGWGWNAAALYKLNGSWKFGASYRSPVKVDLEGNARITTSNSVKTSLTLPDTFQIGSAYRAGEKLLISATADFTDWATYRALVIRTATLGPAPVTATKNWRSVWAFRLGAGYKYSEKLDLRAGAFYDRNPVKEKYFETRVPDSDRLAFSLGAGWALAENITLDASYTFVKFLERTVHDSIQDNAGSPTALNGKYTSTAHLPAVSIGWKFQE